MTSHTVGFVGGGRITAIFLQALGGRGLALDRVTVSDTSAEVLAKLKAKMMNTSELMITSDQSP